MRTPESLVCSRVDYSEAGARSSPTVNAKRDGRMKNRTHDILSRFRPFEDEIPTSCLSDLVLILGGCEYKRWRSSPFLAGFPSPGLRFRSSLTSSSISILLFYCPLYPVPPPLLFSFFRSLLFYTAGGSFNLRACMVDTWRW